VSRNELSELAALDRILAREPVAEEYLELAALVDSVRAGVPRMDPAFQARLDAELAGRRPSRRRWHALTLAGGGAVAAAVAATIVISSGLLNGASGNAPRVGSPAAVTQLVPRHTSAVTLAPTHGAAPRNFDAKTTSRLVHKDASLTLASTPATMQRVANEVVTATEHAGGVVENSSVEIQGASSRASFSLQVPGGRLDGLIATLSSLANVRSLVQNTQDITGGYDAEQARLADSVAERAALLKQLATVATAAQATLIQQQLNGLTERIAAEHRTIDALLRQGHQATLAVEIVPGAAAAAHASAGGPLTTAFHRALRALEQILALALVALAIALPFAVCGLALWWGAANVRARARERAMRMA
jgi:Domain of unknown function (DUF4349)